MKRILSLSFGLLFVTVPLVWSDANSNQGNPDTNAADQNYDQKQPSSVPGTVEKAKDAGDRGLNKVDTAVHKGFNKTKNSAKKTGKKAKKAWNKATEPANKPSKP